MAHRGVHLEPTKCQGKKGEWKMKDEKCCGTCRYNGYISEYGTWGCDCPESGAYGLLTAYDDCCEEWEEKSNVHKAD